MGFWSKLNKKFTGFDLGLRNSGVRATATVISVEDSGRVLGDPEGVSGATDSLYDFRLRVTVPGSEPYEISHRQNGYIAAGREVIVNVDPKDPTNVLIMGVDLDIPEILAEGAPGRAKVLTSEPTDDVSTRTGEPMQRLVLDVTPEGTDPFRIDMRHAVAPDKLPLVVVGADLPVRVVQGEVQAVAIDFAAI